MKKFSSDWQNWFIWVWAGLNTLVAISGVVTNRALYADGSHFFLMSLTGGIANDGKHQRFLINFLNQTLLQLGKLWPELNYDLALFLFGLPLFFLPVILPVLAAWMLRKTHPGLSKLSLIYQTIFVMPSLMFVINPGINFFSLVILNLALLISLKKPSWIHQLTLIGLAIIFFQAHETTLYLMPFLVGLCWWQYKQTRQPILLILAGLYLSNFGYSVWWQNTHPIQSLAQSYSNLLFDLINRADQYIFKMSLLYSVGLVVLLSLRGWQVWFGRIWPSKTNLWQILTLTGYAITCSLVGFYGWQAFAVGATYPNQEFLLRVLITPGAILWVLIGFVPQIWLNQWLNSRALAVAILIVIFGQSLWQLNHSYRWQHFLNSVSVFNQQINQSQRIDLNQIEAAEYQWDWTWPAFSMVLQHGLIKHILYPVWLDDPEQRIKLPNVLGETLETPYAAWDQDGRFLDLSQFHYVNQSKL